MTHPKPPADYHTPRERLTLARIRLKAAKYENGLLRAALRTGKLPTMRAYLGRMIAAVFDRNFR